VFWTKINESIVMDYVDKIVNNGFPISQLELDDMWTATYGDFAIDTDKFPDFTGMVERMRKIGVPRLTAWVSSINN
jgi:alpha-glucosidase (family GH31 glycosyl hydrolase)